MKKKVLSILPFVLLFIFAAGFAKQVYANDPDPNNSKINGTAEPADGSSESSVTLQLFDGSNPPVPVPNDPVKVHTNDSNARLNDSQNDIVTNVDGNGILNFHMTSTTANGTGNITVLDTRTNTTITGTVFFYTPGSETPTPSPSPTPQLGTCTDSAPGSTVVITSSVSAGAHSITLTWTDAASPVTYYLLSYGLSSGNYIYGNPNIGGQGTTSYTVGGLNTGTKYYFVIRAGNGCKPGNFSNEVSAVPGGSSSTITPTPQPEADRPLDETPTLTSTDQITDTPTPPAGGTPTPEPTALPTLAPTSSGGSVVSTVVTVGTILGILIVGGVGVWMFLNYRKTHRRPPPIY